MRGRGAGRAAGAVELDVRGESRYSQVSSSGQKARQERSRERAKRRKSSPRLGTWRALERSASGASPLLRSSELSSRTAPRCTGPTLERMCERGRGPPPALGELDGQGEERRRCDERGRVGRVRGPRGSFRAPSCAGRGRAGESGGEEQRLAARNSLVLRPRTTSSPTMARAAL